MACLGKLANQCFGFEASERVRSHIPQIQQKIPSSSSAGDRGDSLERTDNPVRIREKFAGEALDGIADELRVLLVGSVATILPVRLYA